MNDITSLYDFIDRAEKNRKYLPNVATNFRTPLRMFEKELSEEEKSSIELFKSHIDEIVNVIYSRSNNVLSAASLGIYKRRILQLIDDYENYGKDPIKMASWSRKVLIRKPKEKDVKIISNEIVSEASSLPSFDSSEFQAADLILTNGKARIIVPRELTANDAKRLKMQIDLLANTLDSA